MITTAGKTVLRGRIEAVTALFTGTFWVALSTDATTPALGDTTLTGEQTTNGLGRTSCAVAHTGGTNIWTFAASFVYSGSSTTTINKIGLFDASSGGNLIQEGIISAASFNVSGDNGTMSLVISL